jgi:excisionase family DNA binding protein
MPQNAVRRIEVVGSEKEGDVIAVTEACKFLGVHRNTLYRLIREEELPAFKMTRGGRWRFRRTDLRDWLEDKQAARRP